MLKRLQLRTASKGERASALTQTRGILVLCLLMLALLLLVQVAHTHPFTADADHCPICMVMHSAALVAVAAAILMSVSMVEAIPVALAQPRARVWHYELFNRPPPSNV